jgi:signal transduction histidine kinase
MRLQSIRIPRRYRRAILIYLLTIVTPVCVLLWLGVQSFDRQRQALETLTAEKLEAAIDARTRKTAEAAFREPSHPLVNHFFVIEDGHVVRPALRAPLARPLPHAFTEADHLERERPDLALTAYRRLAADPGHAALALSRVARCLTRLGRHEEAGATWRALAVAHAEARDPFGRPYGIVAAIQAGETKGLLDQIVKGRWELSADQAEYFVAELGGGSTAAAYLDRFVFARELAANFRPPASMTEGEVRSDMTDGRRVFYRSDGPGRIVGFSTNRAALDAIARDVQVELGITNPGARDLRLHIWAVALVSLLLSAGVVVLLRDTTRDARVNQLRAEFVNGVSHELKTPITLVRLYGETLLRHETLGLEERREFYRIITRESTRLGRLVDQILAFSRIERDELRYEMQEGDVTPVVAGVVEDYREWLEHAGFTIVRRIPESAPLVRFDPAAVSQALVNLLDNAAKYSGAARDIAVTLDAGGGEVVIEVEDHGVGIPQPEQRKVFERFYRAAGRSGKGGYGLGLFMVRHIMEVHGGRAEVDSEPGRGSRFRLVFPVVPA